MLCFQDSWEPEFHQAESDGEQIMDFSTRPLIKTRFAPVSGFKNKGSMRMPFKTAAIAVALTAVLALLAGEAPAQQGVCKDTPEPGGWIDCREPADSTDRHRHRRPKPHHQHGWADRRRHLRLSWRLQITGFSQELMKHPCHIIRGGGQTTKRLGRIIIHSFIN